MIGLAVIDAPSGPPGWEDRRAPLIRIVDPSGRAVAWFAPEHGAMCAGLAVRVSGQQGAAWTQVFRSAEPQGTLLSPSDAGCIVLCALDGNSPQPVPRWRYVARDPTALLMEAVIPVDTGDRDTGTRGGLLLQLTAHLDDAALMLTLDAWNQSTRALSPHIAFHLSLASGLFEIADTGDAETRMREQKPQASPVAFVALPGYDISVVLTPVPGGRSVSQTFPSTSGGCSLSLRADVSPMYGAPLERGARSLIGLSITSR